MRSSKNEQQSHSIQHRESGIWHSTIISEATPADVKTLNNDWLFDWKKEIGLFPVCKLVVATNPSIIQGMISLEKNKGFYYVSLIENAPHNRGKPKEFRSIPSNLFAYACKLSHESGFGGFVVFEAKTALVEHYRTTLGAKTIGHSNRMFIDEQQAQELILFHFSKT